MILYKYTDVGTAIKILASKKFRYTQPNAFNDPFEVSPIAEEEIETSFIKENIDYIVSSSTHMQEAYEKTLQGLYENLSPFQKNLVPYETYKSIQIQRIKAEIQKRNQSLEEILLEKVKYLIPDFTNHFFKELPKAIGSATGVLCLSSYPDSILMWSHYANSHFGVVLEIDTNSDFFTNLNEVNYDTRRPSLNVNRDPVDENERMKLAKDIFFTKSKSWEYEKEHRDIKRLDLGINTNIIDMQGYPIILFEFPSIIIKGIIFGSKINKEEKTKYIHYVNELGYNIEFKEASLNKLLFKIDIEICKNIN